ncbi:thioredoxin-like protein [Phakopsora pachyrhizi]|nr:thioredoxin-like protein [Phakopsora pachyrhizi]
MPQVEALKKLDEFNKAVGDCTVKDAGSGDIVAIIDFSATWCGPCRVISPIYEKIASEDNSGKLKYYKVDVDESPDIASKCGISAMPTFIVFKNGSPVDTMKGADQKGLMQMINKYIA